MIKMRLFFNKFNAYFSYTEKARDFTKTIFKILKIRFCYNLTI